MRRYAARNDANQAAILKELARVPGVFVEVIGRPVDLLIWHRGWHLVDIKNPDRLNRSKDPRTDAQKAFQARAPGPVHFCETTEQVLIAVGVKSPE